MPQRGTKNVKTYNRRTEKIKKVSNTDPINKPGVRMKYKVE